MAGQGVITRSQTPHLDLPRTGFRGLSARARFLLALLVLRLPAAGLYLIPSYTAHGVALLCLGAPPLMLLWPRHDSGLLLLVLMSLSSVPADFVNLRFSIGGSLGFRDLALIGMLVLLVFRGLLWRTWRHHGGLLCRG
jgi:hypothetical protein